MPLDLLPRLTFFDVPASGGALAGAEEPMRGVLEPAPDAAWAEAFHARLADADALLKAASPVLRDGAIEFTPALGTANGTCILLKALVIDINASAWRHGTGSQP